MESVEESRDFECEIEIIVSGKRYRVVVSTKECVITTVYIYPYMGEYSSALEERFEDDDPHELRDSKSKEKLYSQHIKL
jgi:hypothetical protein